MTISPTSEELSIAKQAVFDIYIGNPSRYQSTIPTGVVLGAQPAVRTYAVIERTANEVRQAGFRVFALSELAQQRGETDMAYRQRINEFVAQAGR